MAKTNRYEQNRIFLLNDPCTLRLDRALAKEIGDKQSIILLQLEFWISIHNNIRDGRKWYFTTIEELSDFFYCWSKDTIKRAIKDLKDNGYIITGNYNKLSFDRTTWYSINYDKIAELKSIAVRASSTLPIKDEVIDAEVIDVEVSSKEMVWTIITDANPTCPKDKLQNDAVQQLVEHLDNYTITEEDLDSTVEFLEAETYQRPITPTNVLKYVGQVKKHNDGHGMTYEEAMAQSDDVF